MTNATLRNGRANTAPERMAETYAAIGEHPKLTIVELDTLLGRPTSGEVTCLRDRGLIKRFSRPGVARSVDGAWVTAASRLA